MWINLRDVDDIAEAYFASLGRALALAQHFESECKEILLWIEVAMGFEDGRLKKLEDIRSFSEVLATRLLGASVRRLEALPFVDSKKLAALVAAKDARNYLAHEAAMWGLYPSVKYGEKLTALHYVPRLRREIEALAEGDNLVSIWSYEFQEKEAAPYSFSQRYPTEVAAWVLEPLDAVN